MPFSSPITHLAPHHVSQQLTYGVVSEGFFCGKFAEILRKVRGKYVLLCQERVRKFCGKFAEFHGNLRKIFCNDPFPNDPIRLIKCIAESQSHGRTAWPHIARCCDTIAAIPHIARYFFREVSTPPKWCDTPPWHLVSHRHICAIPHFATCRATIVRYPTKTCTKEFCDTIAASIARYEKYRYWASKGKNKVYTTTVETLLFFWGGGPEASVVYTLLSGPMVYILFPCFLKKMI